jgi:hypothetical protein
MKSIDADLEVSIISKLFDIHEITKLCAFAAEARRALNDISVANEVDSRIGALLDDTVTSRNQWIEHEDNLSVVLKHLGHQLDGVINQVLKAGTIS